LAGRQRIAGGVGRRGGFYLRASAGMASCIAFGLVRVFSTSLLSWRANIIAPAPPSCDIVWESIQHPIVAAQQRLGDASMAAGGVAYAYFFEWLLGFMVGYGRIYRLFSPPRAIAALFWPHRTSPLQALSLFSGHGMLRDVGGGVRN